MPNKISSSLKLKKGAGSNSYRCENLFNKCKNTDHICSFTHPILLRLDVFRHSFGQKKIIHYSLSYADLDGQARRSTRLKNTHGCKTNSFGPDYIKKIGN
jgi:hypothetical protein